MQGSCTRDFPQPLALDMLTDILASIIRTKQMANPEDCQIKKRADVLRKWCDGRVESIIAFDRVVEHIMDMSEHDDVDKGMGKRSPITSKQAAEVKGTFMGRCIFHDSWRVIKP